MHLYMRLGISVLVLVMALLVVMKFFKIGFFATRYTERDESDMRVKKPDIMEDFLTVNPYSRPGISTERIRNIVIHYVANPGSTAKQNRDYFEGLRISRKTRASSHFIVGIEGEIVQCVPMREVAFASNDRNPDTISIETCHMKEDGAYTEKTYVSLVKLTAWLCEKFGLGKEDLIRHYDVTGKICPKYFVDHEDAWETFKDDVGKVLEES